MVEASNKGTRYHHSFFPSNRPLQKLLQLATEKRVLLKLRGKSAHRRLSLYADDAAIFINPTTTDVRNIKDILDRFGRVTGLCTNIQKSLVAPICCNGIDLDLILASFLAAKASFAIKYFGTTCLHEQTSKSSLPDTLQQSECEASQLGWQAAHPGRQENTSQSSPFVAADLLPLRSKCPCIETRRS